MISVNTGTSSMYKKPGLIQPAYSVNAVSVSSNRTSETGHKFIFDIFVSTNFGVTYSKVARLKSLPSINNYSTVEFSDVVKNYVESQFLHENPQSIVRYKELGEDAQLNELTRYANMVKVSVLVGEEYKSAGVLNMYDGYGNIGDPAVRVAEFYTTYQALSSNNKETFKIKTSLDNQQINALHFDYLQFIHKAVQNQSDWKQNPEAAPGIYELTESEIYSSSRNAYVGDKTYTNFGVRYLSNQPTERQHKLGTPTTITYLEGADIYIPHSEDDNWTWDLTESYVGRAYDEVGVEDNRYWHYYNNFRNRVHTIGYEFFDIAGNVVGEIKYQPNSTIFGNPMKTGLMDGVDFPYTDGSSEPFATSKWREVEFAAYPEIADIEKYMNSGYESYNTILSEYVGYGLFNGNYDYSELFNTYYGSFGVVNNPGRGNSSEMRGDCKFSDEYVSPSKSFQMAPQRIQDVNMTFSPYVSWYPFPFRDNNSPTDKFEGERIVVGVNSYVREYGQDGSGLFRYYTHMENVKGLDLIVDFIAGGADPTNQGRVRIAWWDGFDYDWHYDSGWIGTGLNHQINVEPKKPLIDPSYSYEENMKLLTPYFLGSDYPGVNTTLPGQFDRVIIEFELTGNTPSLMEHFIDARQMQYGERRWMPYELYSSGDRSLFKFKSYDAHYFDTWSYYRMINDLRFRYTGSHDVDSVTMTVLLDVTQTSQPGDLGDNRNLLDRDMDGNPIFHGDNWYVPYVDMLLSPSRDGSQEYFTNDKAVILGVNKEDGWDYSAALGLSIDTDAGNVGEYPSITGWAGEALSWLGKKTYLFNGLKAPNGRPPIEILESKALPNVYDGQSRQMYMTFRINYGANIPGVGGGVPADIYLSLHHGLRSNRETLRVDRIQMFEGTINDNPARLYGAVDYRINIYDTDAPVNLVRDSICDAGTFQSGGVTGINASIPGLNMYTQNVKDTAALTWWNDDVDGFYDEPSGVQYGVPRNVLRADLPTLSASDEIMIAPQLCFPDDTQMYYVWANDKTSDMYQDGFDTMYGNLTKLRFVVDCMVFVERNDATTTITGSNIYINPFEVRLVGYSGSPIPAATYTSKYMDTDRGTWKRIYQVVEYDQVDMAQLYGVLGSNNTSMDFRLNFDNNGSTSSGVLWSDVQLLISDLRAYFVPESVTDIEEYVKKHYANSQLKINVGQEPFYKQFNDLKMNDAYSLFWLNPYGTWDNYRFKGKSVKTVDINRSQRGVGLDKTGDLTSFYGVVKQSFGDNIDYNINATEVYELRTDYIRDDERTWLEELMVSPKVFMYDENSGWFVRVNGLTGNYSNIVEKNQKLFQLSLEVQVSQERRTQQVLGLK